MPRADLTIGLRADRITPHLRADQIRHDTLITLAAAWADPEARTELENLLDDLGAAVTGRARDGETDALVADIEAAADMGRAEMSLSRAELDQLAEQAAGAVNALTPAIVPAQARGEAA